MKFNIRRAWGEPLNKYEDILDKYGALYEINKRKSKKNYKESAVIEIKTIEQMLELMKDLDESLIVDKNGSITIYDDYVE